MHNDKPLIGKVAIVTGSCGEGIGSSVALALAKNGANMVLNYGTGRDDKSIAKSAFDIQTKIMDIGRNAIIIKADITKEAQVKRLFKKARNEFGKVDILVCNAGWTWLDQDFTEITYKRWQKTFAAEIDGTFLCMKEAIPTMRAQNWGRIVNIILDFTVMDTLLMTRYSHIFNKYPLPFIIAKKAKMFLAHHMAYKEYQYGITINNILPGIIEFMNFEEACQLSNDPKIQERGMARPTDVANLVVFLSRDEAKFITGSDIKVPGNIYLTLNKK